MEHKYTGFELEKIDELRARVEKELTNKSQHDDSFLISWLRARNMNVDRAEEMLRNSLNWRKEHNVDGILSRESIPDKFKGKLPLAYLGMEKETGCPVFLFLMGRFDFRKNIEEDGFEVSRRHNIVVMEMLQAIMKDCSKKVGRPVTSFIELVDLEGYSLRQVATKECRDAGAYMQQMFDANYPEIVKHVLLINAPKVFSFVFNFFKPFIAKATLDKTDIMGPDVEKWQAAVSKRFPLELLPPHWGGTLAGNDEYCSDSDIWILGPLGPKYFSGGNYLHINH
jgi:hypothetical protein